METDLFYVYRCFIIPTSHQYNIYDNKLSKENLFNQEIIRLSNSNKTVFQYWKNRHIIFFDQIGNDRLFTFRYAKPIVRTKKVEGDQAIHEIIDAELKTVKVIIDIKWQYFLVEKNTREFNNREQVINAWESYLSQRLRFHGYTIKISELPEKKDFWEFVSKHENINRLSLSFNAPNILFGNMETREALKQIKNDCNNDEVSIMLKSRENMLVISEKIGKYVDYISDVGGKYLIAAKSSGKTYILKSHEAIKTMRMPKSFDSHAKDKLINIIDELHKDDKGR
jgi:hypothetical protein